MCVRAFLPRDGDTLGVAVLGADGLLQLVELTRLLQLLHQALHSLLTPLLLLGVELHPSTASAARAPWTLFPTQETLHHRGGEGQDGGHGGRVDGGWGGGGEGNSEGGEQSSPPETRGGREEVGRNVGTQRSVHSNGTGTCRLTSPLTRRGREHLFGGVLVSGSATNT